ncbi:MAG: hypothetical protein IJT03_06500 [Clostridia bacterium]|nr:hypothetical protein [Clostridia bacterium]
MKRKRFLSMVLCLILLVSSSTVAAAENALPESEHNYADNAHIVWEYSLDNAPYGLYITFSEDTCFEPIDYSASKTGDWLTIYTPSESFAKMFTGSELAGAEVYVPDHCFRLSLTSDESVNAYGFKVTSVRAAEKDEVYSVLCHPCTEDADDFSLCFSKRATAVPENFNFNEIIFPSFYREGWYLAGWAREPGGEICCDMTDSPSPDTTELWAHWIRLSLSRNEILPFSNGEGFNVDGKNRYYLTAHDYFMYHRNLYRTFGVGPFPTPIVSAVNAINPFLRKYRGSCFGMAVVTALQHYGYIDVLPMQNASCMAEMQPEKELISIINYYWMQQAADWPVENKLYIAGSPLFKEQMKNLYQSAAGGNVVLFGSKSMDHTVLVTAAYTNAKGEHILVAYDNNVPAFYGTSYNTLSSFTISSDWSSIKYAGVEDVTGIYWTDDFSHFESLDLSGKGSVLAWHRAFFRHIKTVFLVLWQIMSKAF